MNETTYHPSHHKVATPRLLARFSRSTVAAVLVGAIAVVPGAALSSANAAPKAELSVETTTQKKLETLYKKLTPKIATISRILRTPMYGEGPVFGTMVTTDKAVSTVGTRYCAKKDKDDCLFERMVDVKILDTTDVAWVTGGWTFEGATVKTINGIKVYSLTTRELRVAVTKVGKVVVMAEVKSEYLDKVSDKQIAAIAKAYKSRG